MPHVWMIAILPFLLYAWVVSDPEAVFELYAEMKRRFRLYVIEKFGRRAYEAFEREFREKARQGYCA
jgi:hypothetical protein